MAVTKATFNVWIVAISDSYTEQIIGRLVRRNWEVVALGNTLSLRNDDNMATLLAFSLSKYKTGDEKTDPTQGKVLEEVQDVLKRLDVKYYSVVVVTQPSAGCTWTLGNVTKSSIEKEEAKRVRSQN